MDLHELIQQGYKQMGWNWNCRKIYSLVGKQMGLPEQAMIGRIGTKLIYGGAVGGFFDPPGHPGGYELLHTANVTPNVMVQNRSQTNRAFATAQR